MHPTPTVFVVDDDDAVRNAISRLLKSVDLHSETFGSAQDFLDNYDPGRPGCLVLDVRMPGMSGLDLQEILTTKRIMIPVIIVTGHADVPMAVRAMKMGATDFIEKPFNPQALLDSIKQAVVKDTKLREVQSKQMEIAECIAQLTPRERDVMELMIVGKANKVIASDLGLSQKTVEFHRSNVMKKMGVSNAAELVRLVGIYRGDLL